MDPTINGSMEEAYAAEAKARWGETQAYREYENRPKQTGTEARLMAIFTDFGALRGGDPAAEAAQAQVKALQRFINANYYTCTDEILFGLGQTYVADERFRANIDAAGGEGTAEFVKTAIEAYCKKA